MPHYPVPHCPIVCHPQASVNSLISVFLYVNVLHWYIPNINNHEGRIY